MVEPADTPALVEALNADPRVDAAIVFGSAARGTLRDDSDVDVAVLYRDVPAAESVRDDVVSVLGRLGSAAGRIVHLVDLERVPSDLQRTVFAEGRIVLDRSGGRLGRLRAAAFIAYFDWAYARSVIDRAQSRRLEQARGRP